MNKKILFQTAILLLKKSFRYFVASIKYKHTKINALIAPVTINSMDFSGNLSKNKFYLSSLEEEWLLKRDQTGGFSIYYLNGTKVKKL